MDTTGKKLAAALSTGTKNPPTMTLGTLAPNVVSIFERYCKHHFITRDVATDKQVIHIASRFQDPLIQNWYFNDVASWNLKSFDNFMTAFCKRWLKKNWENDLHTKISRFRQKDDQAFDEWIEDIERQNNLLTGHSLKLNETTIRQHVLAFAWVEICKHCITKAIQKISNYRDWKDTIDEFDQCRCIKRSRCKKEMETFLRCRPATGNSTHSYSNPATSGTATSTTTKTLPKLTSVERDFLQEHDGCFKCRRINAKHTSKDCPNDFPDPATYKPVTEKVDTMKSTKVNAIVDTSTPGPAPASSPHTVASSVLSIGDSLFDTNSEYVHLPLISRYIT